MRPNPPRQLPRNKQRQRTRPPMQPSFRLLQTLRRKMPKTYHPPLEQHIRTLQQPPRQPNLHSLQQRPLGRPM